MRSEDDRYTGLEQSGSEASGFPLNIDTDHVHPAQLIDESVKTMVPSHDEKRIEPEDDHRPFRLPPPYSVRVSRGLMGKVLRALYNVLAPYSS